VQPCCISDGGGPPEAAVQAGASNHHKLRVCLAKCRLSPEHRQLAIDGRTRFAKLSIDDGKKVEIAAIDPDFNRGLQPLSLMEYAGRFLNSLTSFPLPG